MTETSFRTSPVASPPSASPRARLLVAEDDRVSRVMLRSLLERRGFGVETVPNGVALLERLRKIIDGTDLQPVDLVITDNRMPGMSGLDVLAALPASSRLPDIIIVSAFAGETVKRKARRLGAFAVLAKPFNLDELLTMISAALDRER